MIKSENKKTTSKREVKYNIEISNIRNVAKKNLLCFFSAKINNVIILNNLKLFEGDTEYYIGVSQSKYMTKDNEEKYSNDYFIIDEELKEEIIKELLAQLDI